ncbi:MAG: hypothetical protein JHD16_06960 [Solirubrobacteraceae bacterium]|nr:hypothetical protein [Solirubrobacteraceae bacterium]
MSPRPTLARPAALAVAITCSAMALTSPSASAAELVSRDGDLPFAASLAAASADGRYVVMKLGTPNTRIAPTGPEADVQSPSGFVIRDRTAQTVTPLTLERADGTPLTGAAVKQISTDGTRVLAVAGGAPFVIDVASGKPLALPTTPGIVVGAQLSDDGTKAVVSTTGTDFMNNPTKDNALYRGPIGGTGTELVKLYGIRLASASGDLGTVLYSRELPKVSQPNNPSNSFRGTVVGIKQGTGEPRVLAQSSLAQFRRSATTCSPDYLGIRTIIKDVAPTALSADGGRVAWSMATTDSDFQGRRDFGYRVRQADGITTSFDQIAGLSPSFEALGRSHDVTLIPLVAFRNSPTTYTRVLVDNDRTLISSDQRGAPGPGPEPTRYVTAEAFEPGETTAPSTLSFTGYEPVDSPTLAPDAVFASCEGAPAAPVATVDAYTVFTKTSPTRSSAPIGSLFLNDGPVGFRKAVSATAELKVFGFTAWKRTLKPNELATLPRPWLWLPMTLRVSVQAEAAGGVTPPPVVKQYAIYANR